MEVIDRIQELVITKSGNNKREFTRVIGIKYTTFDNQLKANNFSQKVLCAILEAFPDIDANWLLMGEGDIHKSSAINQPQEPMPIAEEETDDKNSRIKKLEEQSQMLLHLLADKDRQMAQLIDLLSSSQPSQNKKEMPA